MHIDALELEANAALHSVGRRLLCAQQHWGVSHFPEDCGIKFRNTLYMYAYTYLGVLCYELVQKPEGQWCASNRRAILGCKAPAVMHLIGLSHFHVQARLAYISLDESKRLVNALELSHPERAPLLDGHKRLIKTIHQSWDWINNAYDLEDGVAATWNRIVMDADSFDQCLRESKNLMYSQICKLLSSDPADSLNANSWEEMAFKTFVCVPRRSQEEWHQIISHNFACYQ
jgi:hypothetical protein